MLISFSCIKNITAKDLFTHISHSLLLKWIGNYITGLFLVRLCAIEHFSQKRKLPAHRTKELKNINLAIED